MLESLSIKNYALIDDIKVDLHGGLTMITGETGAGKSVILGALSLLLGNRAHLDSVKDKSTKCIIEGQFGIGSYNLKPFFETYDLDFDLHTIIRRELLPSGKSRAFINDTPVTLQTLSALGSQLIDIHSQHETLTLGSGDFKFYLVDTLAKNGALLQEYRNTLATYKEAQAHYNELLEAQASATKEYDYNLFLLNELTQLKLDTLNEADLEEEQETLANVATIQETLSEAYELLANEQLGLTGQIGVLVQRLNNLSGVSSKFQALADRAESMRIELTDFEQEVFDLQGSIEPDPQRLVQLETVLQQLYDLKRKHAALSITELVAVEQSLSKQVALVQDDASLLESAKANVAQLKQELEKLSLQIHNSRKKAIPLVASGIQSRLVHLELQDAQFKVALNTEKEFNNYGSDSLDLLFSANKGIAPAPLKKVASGGELSRLMLAIKALLAKEASLATLIFDEIDTGVSGLVANKMGDIMQQMSTYMQIVCITHLPQVAAKGQQQFKVYKETVNNKAVTKIVSLNQEERIVEIAQMLGGQKISETALNHAKELLN